MTRPTINTPLVLHVNVPATAEAPAFSATAMLDKDRQQYYANSVSLQHPSVRLTSERISRTPVQRTMAPQLRAALAEANPKLLEHPIVQRWATDKAGRKPAARLVEHPTQDLLTAAELTYRLARLCGQAPVIAVARAAGLTHSDASRWLRAAKKCATS